MAVSRLLILDWKSHDKRNKYSLEVPTQHPFITILIQEKLSWRSVLNQMKLIMHHHDKQYVFFIRIILFHVREYITLFALAFINWSFLGPKNVKDTIRIEAY